MNLRRKHLNQLRDDPVGFKARVRMQVSVFDRIADWMTTSFGTMWFLIVNIAFFAVWMVLNSGKVSGFVPFDPYPFELLTMIVSLEAIILSVIVLISQNRAARLADLREEIDFEINVRAEDEITRMLNMLDEIHDHLGLGGSDDEELARMKQKTNIKKIHEDILREAKAEEKR